MNKEELKYKLPDIAKGVKAEYGDNGSSVMGMKLLIEGEEYAGQIAQGSITNEVYLTRVKIC